MPHGVVSKVSVMCCSKWAAPEFLETVHLAASGLLASSSNIVSHGAILTTAADQELPCLLPPLLLLCALQYARTAKIGEFLCE